MLKKILNIAILIPLVVSLASCGSTKKLSQKKKSVAEVEKKTTNTSQEYNAFFEAEKARIKGDIKRARTLYRDFVKQYKNNAAAYYNLAGLEFKSFNFKDAERYASSAVKLAPKNKYYLEKYADVLSLNKKPKEAVKIYEQLSSLYSEGSAEYAYKMYRIYADLGEHNKAYKTLNKLERSWGVSKEITMQKVELLLKLKKEDAAIKEIQQLVNDEPQNPSHKEKLANLYDRLNRKEEAKKIYEELVDDAPNDAKVLMRSSSYYLRNKDTIGFQKVVKKIVANPKIDKSIRMSMLMPLIELNKNPSYIKNEVLPIVQSMKTDNDDKETVKMYADLLYGAKQYSPASEAYRNYLNLDKSKFSVWFNLMLCHSNLENLDSIVAVADESFDYFPNNALTHYFKGSAQYQKQDYKQSISSFESAIDLEPEEDLKAQIYSMMGDANNSLKNYNKADENFEASLKIKEDATTLNNYAYYLSLRNERLNDALKMSGKSLKLQPEAKTFLDTYGWILFKQGKYKKAKEYVEKAIEGDGDADVLEHLGDIYFKLNETTKAQEYWLRAKKVGGGSDMLDKKIREGNFYE